jgi:hypothetical protein
MELALRFVIATKFDIIDEVSETDIGPYITNRMKKLLDDEAFQSSESVFTETFSILNQELGDNAFKRYSSAKGRYEGQFSVSLFEYLTSGVAFAISNGDTKESIAPRLHQRSKAIVEDAEFLDATKHGSRGITRFPKLLALAKRHFVDP